jgi:hypothetical protein
LVGPNNLFVSAFRIGQNTVYLAHHVNFGDYR